MILSALEYLVRVGLFVGASISTITLRTRKGETQPYKVFVYFWLNSKTSLSLTDTSLSFCVSDTDSVRSVKTRDFTSRPYARMGQSSSYSSSSQYCAGQHLTPHIRTLEVRPES